MKTYCYQDAATPVEISEKLDLIAEALDSCGALCNESQPCSAYPYYDEGEEQPWRISMDGFSESYSTVEEAVAAAEVWFN